MNQLVFSENMRKQLAEPRLLFETKKKAEYYGITKYGSGSQDKVNGWYIEDV